MSNQDANQFSAVEFIFKDSEWGNLDIYRFQLIQVCKFSLFLQNIIKTVSLLGNLSMENFKMVAKTFFGFEDILAKELLQLGAQEVEQGVRVVTFKGDKGFMYKANLSLRTALKILKPIYFFRATNEEALYKGIQGVNWSKYINANQTFVIDATVHSDRFNHTEFVAQKCKDAIVDQFRTRFGQRPSVEKQYPDLRINIHIDKEQVSVALDTSGNSLH